MRVCTMLGGCAELGDHYILLAKALVAEVGTQFQPDSDGRGITLATTYQLIDMIVQYTIVF